MTDHPITLPPELVQQWMRSVGITPANTRYVEHIATQAARWGADQELEACKEWMSWRHSRHESDELLFARRPKPPSLKEQALAELAKVDVLWDTDEFGDETNAALDTIRRALEQLSE